MGIEPGGIAYDTQVSTTTGGPSVDATSYKHAMNDTECLYVIKMAGCKRREFVPEVPFGRRDKEETLFILRNELAKMDVNRLDVDNENVNGRDCAYLAMKYGVKADQHGCRRVKDDDTMDSRNRPTVIDINDRDVPTIRGMIAEHIEAV